MEPKYLLAVLAGLVANAIVEAIIERSTNKNLVAFAEAFSVALLACGSLTLAFSAFLYSQIDSKVTLINTMAFFVIFTIILHMVAKQHGYRASNLNRDWVRGIDYIYLSLSAFGIIKLLTVSTALTNTAAALILAFAIAVRITKTSIEIFQWDKPPKDRH